MARLDHRLSELPPDPDGFLPDFCRITMVFAVVVTSELLAIVLTLASSSPASGFWERLGPLSLYIQLIALTGAGVLCGLRPLLARMEARAAAVAAWVLLMIITATVGCLTYALLPWGGGVLFPEDGLSGLLIRSLGICAIVGILLIRYLYLHYMWRRQVEAEAEAHFQKLQARIRPHFLFNSLNTIANLIHTNADVAEELLHDLADLFRAALGNGGKTTTLAKELELSRRYLHIEKQRLGGRMSVEWDIEELPGNAILPPLILQPLVENAVYHGIQPSRGPGVIRIGGRYRRGQVNLSVRNTLPEDPQSDHQSSGNRIAMDNVRQRLAAMYQGRGQVIEARVEGDYQVRLVFPHPWSEP